MSEILKAAGTSLERVVKINIFTSDFSKMAEFNSVFNDYFPQKPPRTSVQVTKLPLDVSFEVDIVAIV
ncbi:hypothetical protein BP6252_05565 [Coleophoma cylindrospora]|uniref:YjgF-like protein n=1 Tax=Coleophoma cylindrospora TaxID=1849047 RepID=A0A3D8RTT5_9HELO|nr:hypothetical protein BP6252_05565 [Coleophoma cylindrospora]